MKKLFSSVGIFALGLVLFACSSDKSEQEQKQILPVKIEESEVYGENSDVISVIPDTYDLTLGKRLSIKVRLKLEKQITDKIDFINGPQLRLKNEEGLDVVDDYNQMVLAAGDQEKMETFITKDVGTEQDFVFVNDFSYDYTESAMKDTKSFTIENLHIVYESDKDIVDKMLESGLSENDTANDGEAVSDEEIDKMLDDYESLVDSYAKIAKKVKDGDLFAVAESANMTTKAMDFVDKLEKFDGKMSAVQLKRFTEIQAKMAKLSVDMVF